MRIFRLMVAALLAAGLLAEAQQAAPVGSDEQIVARLGAETDGINAATEKLLLMTIDLKFYACEQRWHSLTPGRRLLRRDPCKREMRKIQVMIDQHRAEAGMRKMAWQR